MTVFLSLALVVAAEKPFSFADDICVPCDVSDAVPEILRQYVERVYGPVVVRLGEEDYRAVARELDVEPAAIKAVVDIETGRTHTGFFSHKRPLINFDVKVFRGMCARRGIKLPHGAAISRRGAGQKAAYSRLEAACDIDSVTAVESTFWGMFQIGGFNWKLCGATDVWDFVGRMCSSERAQLELFAGFLKNTGLVEHLRTKNWSAFARHYNGPKYAAHGYHTRLAQAYARHCKGK